MVVHAQASLAIVVSRALLGERFAAARRVAYRDAHAAIGQCALRAERCRRWAY